MTHFYPTTFFLISNKAEAKGKFRLFLNWQLLFNFARPLAILSTESANILICFCCTSTKRAVWDQNEVLGWDLRSRTRGWCRTQNTYKFVTKKVQRLVLAHLKDFGWQELQNTFPADLYHQMGGTDSGGINEIFLNNRINSYNWLLVEIDVFVKIVVYPNFYIKFSYFSVVLVGKTFVLVVSNNQFNTQTKFETIIPSWWGFTACQSKLGACKLAHISHFFLAVLRTLIRKLALMKSGQMSVFWIFFTKNSKNTIISYIYHCFMTIFYQKTCLESCLKYVRYHNFLAFLAVFGPFFEPKTSSKVLMCWE